jgi:hypothetical protein
MTSRDHDAPQSIIKRLYLATDVPGFNGAPPNAIAGAVLIGGRSLKAR